MGRFDFKAQMLISKKQEIPSDDQTTKLKRYVEGYCVVADVVDEQRDLIEPEALKSAVQYLNKFSTVLFNHNPDRPIGKVEKAEVRGNNIWVRVLISEHEDEIWHKILEGVINAFSISGSVEDYEYRSLPGKGTVRVIKSFSIYEISLVTVPANPEAKTLTAYLAKALGSIPESVNKSVGGLNLLDILELTILDMEVSKMGKWVDKVKQALKALNVVVSKAEDTELKDALEKIQSLLVSALAEADDSYGETQQKSLEELKGRVDQLEQTVNDLKKSMDDVIQKQQDMDAVLGDLADVLKQIYSLDEPNTDDNKQTPGVISG